MKHPKRIYKYEPMSIQALMNLKSEAIYFNAPSNFNDPYDCSMDVKVDAPYVDEIPRIRKFLNEELEYLEKGKEDFAQIEAMSDDEIAAMGMVMAQDFVKQKSGAIFNTKGVCCFSRANDNLLMWSHYASSGKGFCLEFDATTEPFNKVQPVKYQKEPPTLNYERVFSVDTYFWIEALFCTKSIHWSYEKEYRIFHNEVNKVAHYPSNSLTGVYFGPEVDDAFAETICLILQGQNPSVKFYRGSRSNDSYKVQFEEVSYTPYVLKNA
ncbi:DUF2971 domain-containing protein [Vibrio gallaecicus]|uniref:DUF2971 domain-containing protein n=1 Tax=Vibrio gallaecicus TaxID=552386 RepID=A0ABV4NFH6_9VIBR